MRCRWTPRFRRQILGGPMPQENVEIVRRSLAEFDRGGIDSALGYFDPEIDWTTTDAYIESANYRGRKGVRSYFETMAAEFEDLRIEADLRLAGVSSLRDGKIVRIRNYQDLAQAIEALEVRD
jgi:ketosteroid isomerase-like protein